MTHPLSEFELQGVNIKYFDENGVGFISFPAVAVIIGKNNAGKSSVVDLIDIAIHRKKPPFAKPSQLRGDSHPAIDVKSKITHAGASKKFKEGAGGGDIPGNHGQFGKQFVGLEATWRYIDQNDATSVDVLLSEIGLNEQWIEPALKKLKDCDTWFLDGYTLLRVSAERSVDPEPSTAPEPEPNGRGVTNLIRYFINNDAQPREAVEVDLLRDLNVIYSGDSEFLSIICQENDVAKTWEIFLKEEDKGDIRLSESGSSLQSVFIILPYLKLVPRLQYVQWEQLILAIEEPENNLHPALLRRLINFLAEKRKEFGFSLVMTTHSPVWALLHKSC